MTQTVLIAGATGMLGHLVAYHLLDEPDTKVRLMVRSLHGNDQQKSIKLQELVHRGAELVQADLTDTASLDLATKGVDVIVSAVQGMRSIIVDGQLALLAAAKRNDVRRMLPSDFALDLFKAPQGEHLNFNLRREADEVIAESGLEHIHVLNGAFMDNFLNSSFGGVFDMEAGTATYWGDGTERFDATSVEDTARYTARASVDRALRSGKFAIAGEQLSFSSIIDSVEKISDRRFDRRSRGSIADLEALIARQRASDPNSMEALGNTYLLYMLDGKTSLENLKNNRYADLQPESYIEHVRRTWEQAK